MTAERGKRRERAPNADIRRQPRPEGTEVLREFGDRLIIQLNNQVMVESSERPRMTRNAQEVYYEDLPRGRTREMIVRDNGNQIVTIRNRYGDIVRRSRITPDGREYVLSYVDDRHYDDMDQWRDPGLDLPPLRLHHPARRVHPRRRSMSKIPTSTTTSSSSRRWSACSASTRSTRSSVRPACATSPAASISTR